MPAHEMPEASEPTDASRVDLGPLVASANALKNELRSIYDEHGAYLDNLAAVDWAALGERGRLAGIPRFSIERTIADAQHVLTSGQRDLSNMLEQAQQPPDDMADRLQAVIRLYTDTPSDMRNRVQRLAAWVTTINRELQQHNEPLLDP